MDSDQEAQALRYPLFQDDFGEPGDKVFSDRIVTCAKPAQCNECWEQIQVGSRYRRHVGKYGGRVSTYKFCCDCCIAMGKTFNGDWNAMDERAIVRKTNVN